nr:hypothetical protein [Tanacetum cinerariifolium]
MEKDGSLFSNLTSKIKNVDGKLIGKDDKGTVPEGVPTIEVLNTPTDGFDIVHGKFGNGGTKPISFSSVFKDNTPKKTVKLSELSNEDSVEGTDAKVAAPTQVSDDIFVEVTRKHGKRKQNGKPRHFVGVRLTKPQPNYFYHDVSKQMCKSDSDSEPINKQTSLKFNVNGEASTSQPKENKEAASQPKSYAFSALEEANGKFIDDTQKRWRLLPRRLPGRLVFGWVGKDVMDFDDTGQAVEEVEHENAYSDNG